MSGAHLTEFHFGKGSDCVCPKNLNKYALRPSQSHELVYLCFGNVSSTTAQRHDQYSFPQDPGSLYGTLDG